MTQWCTPRFKMKGEADHVQDQRICRDDGVKQGHKRIRFVLGKAFEVMQSFTLERQEFLQRVEQEAAK